MITVLVPTYNGSAFIEATIASKRAQTLQDFHCVIVDDGSTDRLALDKVLGRAMKGMINCSAIFYPHVGMVENWNRALHHVRPGSEWIKFVHQDDLLLPTCLERMAASKAQIVACKRDILLADDVDPNAALRLFEKIAEHTIERSYDAFSFVSRFVNDPGHNQIGEPVCVMLRPSCIERYGRFNDRLCQIADWEYFARIACNEGIDFINDPLVLFRVHNGSASARPKDLGREAAVLLGELLDNDHFWLVRKTAERRGVKWLVNQTLELSS